METQAENGGSLWRRVLIVAGPLAFVAAWLLLRPTGGSQQGSPGAPDGSAAAIVIGLLCWMAIWWSTQVVDMAVTGLLPILVLPLTGAAKADATLAPYANDVIFLFAGGCVIGLAIERHGLGSRLMTVVMGSVGNSPVRLVSGILVVTAVISAFVSNTATAAMMLPLAMATAGAWADGSGPDSQRHKQLFQRAVLLAVAYGASIGGVMTVLGSPPNMIGAEWIAANTHEMDFLRWLKIGGPISLLMLLAAVGVFYWVVPLSKVPQLSAQVSAKSERQPMDRGARLVTAIFLLAVSAWIVLPILGKPLGWPKVSDGTIAVGAALALFVVPSTRGGTTPLVPWSQTQHLPWGAFILFGGGMSLAEAMQSSGVSQMIAQCASGLGGLPEPMVVAAVAAVMVFASEIGSNTALAATAVPIVGALAPGLGIPPEKLVIAAVMGASLAFMLPVGTPPNALVFATGLVPMREMMRVGLVLNLCSIAAITIICSWLL